MHAPSLLVAPSLARSFAAAWLVTASLALSAAGCGAGGASAQTAATSKIVGSKAPALTGEVVGGKGPKSLADAAGKVVIVDFWATYCEPCKESLPTYQRLVDSLGGDLVVIAVSRDDADDKKPEDLLGFASELKLGFGILWDKKGDDAGQYEPAKMPTAYVIDKQGVVRYVHAGYESGEELKIEAEVRDLLTE